MNVKMDLSQWKHVKSDEHSTTLKHDKGGHELVIAHKSLSPKHAEQLKAMASPKAEPQWCKCDETEGDNAACPMHGKKMAEGGKAVENPKLEESKKQPPKPYMPPVSTQVERPVRPDTGHGKVIRKLYADPEPGEPVSADDSAPESTAPEAIAAPQPEAPAALRANPSDITEAHKKYLDIMSNIGSITNKTEDEAANAKAKSILDKRSAATSNPDLEAGKHLLGEKTSAPAQPPAPGSVEDTKQWLAQERAKSPQAPAGVEAPMASDTAPPGNPAVSQKAPAVPAGPSQGQQIESDIANRPGLDASGQGNDQSGLVEQSPIGDALTKPQPAALTKQTFDQEYLAAKNDYLSGKISPKTYSSLFHYNGGDATKGERSTLSKLGLAFSMLVGGMGSGLTHQPNAVMDMMNKEIDRDLEAQKQSKTNQLNFLNAVNQHHNTESEISLRRQQGKEMAAQTGLIQANTALANQNYTKTQMLLGLLGQTNDQVKVMPPGPNKVRAQQALGVMNNAIDQHVNQSNAMTAQQIEANWQKRNEALNYLAPEMAKYDAEHHIPGIPGKSSLPMDKQARESRLELNNFGSSLNDAQDFLKRTGKLGAMSPAMRAEGANLQNRIELQMGTLEGLGRFTGEEAKRYKQMMPDLNGTHFTQKDAQALKSISNELAEKQKNFASEYGTPGPERPVATAKTPQQPVEGSRATSGGKPIIFRGGRWIPANQ